jgi:hypothetical protein
MIDKGRLIERLRTQCGYSESGAKSLAGDAAAMPDKFRQMAARWLDDGSETDYSLEGFSVFGLMKSKGFNYLNALNALAWLAREPDEAKAALSRPYDRVVGGGRR